MNNKVVLKTAANGVGLTEFRAFSEYPEIVAGNSHRSGGVSTGIYESMNLGFNRGDSEECVRENYRRFCEALQVPCERLVFPKQTHSVNVRVVSEADAGIGMTRPIPYEDVDGHMTNCPNLPLLAFGSDCVPVLFYDPVNEAIGACHAGWRGTVGGIVRNMVSKMTETYGTKPEDLITVIGPSICGTCFEIGPEVAEEFRAAFPGQEDSVLIRKNEEKFVANLWEANRLMLLQAGVIAEHIEVSGECTMCHPERYWSHRATKGQRGSNATLIMRRARGE